MKDSQATVEVTVDGLRAREFAEASLMPALVLACAREEPARVGEVLLIDAERVFGRGEKRDDDPAPRAFLVRQRPDGTVATPVLESVRLSRQALVVAPRGGGASIKRAGRLPLFVNGASVEEAEVSEGDTVRLGSELVFFVTRRPRFITPLRSYPKEGMFAFGGVDPDGMVGESPRAWRLRDELAFAARSGAHVLVHGASGSGKELAAQALHRLSPRGRRAIVSRNAATFPEGIIDAELFGNVKNYPNPGMPEREGLIGEASGTTLFLDEIGEIPAHLQAHLLRVLDAKGEHQRLGDARVRTADLRVVAATNRAPADLKHDFAARLTVRVRVPGLGERCEDVPLLARHLLCRMAEKHEDLRSEEPRLDAELVEALLGHGYPREVRDLEQILWASAADRRDNVLLLTESVRALIGTRTPERASEPTRDEIQAILTRAQGSITRAARELGLKNRFALYRLLKKHGIEVATDEG